MVPVRFQPKETAGWVQWLKGNVDAQILATKVDPHNETVYVNGCSVFALYFENGRIWNCQTGWQTKGML